MIINAGIKRVIFARPNGHYEVKEVSEWVENDETLTDKFGY
jgi:deoxycytidylate deaminase